MPRKETPNLHVYFRSFEEKIRFKKACVNENITMSEQIMIMIYKWLGDEPVNNEPTEPSISDILANSGAKKLIALQNEKKYF